MGQNEQPFPFVGGPDLLRGDTRPLRIEPDFGKIGEDIGEPRANAGSDLLEEHDGTIGLLDDAEGVGPEMPFVVDAVTLAGEAERLARAGRGDDVDGELAPGNVRDVSDENRRRIQVRVLHPFQEDGRGEAIQLDTAQ